MERGEPQAILSQSKLEGNEIVITGAGERMNESDTAALASKLSNRLKEMM
jgi:hypothetical protein